MQKLSGQSIHEPAIHAFNERISMSSFTKIRDLLDRNIMREIENNNDIAVLPGDRVFERMERVFIIHSTCLNEVCHLLSLANMRDLGIVLLSVFQGYKYIFETMVNVFNRERDEKESLKNRKGETVYVVKEVESRKFKVTENMFLDNFVDEKKAAEEKNVKKKLHSQFNFQADEELQLLREKRRKLVMEKVRAMMTEVEFGKTVDLTYITEPDILFAFSNELLKSMRQDGDNNNKNCAEMIAEIELFGNIKAEAPERIERIVENIMTTVNKINPDRIQITDLDDDRIKDVIAFTEKEMMIMFDHKQRDIALRVLRTMKRVFRPPMKNRGEYTPLSSKDIDKLLKPNPDGKAGSKIKLSQEERMQFKMELNESHGRINQLENVINELIEQVNAKESEVYSLVKRYEREKYSEAEMENRRSRVEAIANRFGKIMAEKGVKGEEKDGIDLDRIRERVKNMAQKLISAVVNYSKSIGQESIPAEAYDKLKVQFKEAAEAIFKEELADSAGLLKPIEVEEVFKEQFAYMGMEPSKFPTRKELKARMSQMDPRPNPTTQKSLTSPKYTSAAGLALKEGQSLLDQTVNDGDDSKTRTEGSRYKNSSRDNTRLLGKKNLGKSGPDDSFRLGSKGGGGGAGAAVTGKGKGGGAVLASSGKTTLQKRKSTINADSIIDGIEKEGDVTVYFDLQQRIDEIENANFLSDVIELIDAVKELGDNTNQRTFRLGNGRIEPAADKTSFEVNSNKPSTSKISNFAPGGPNNKNPSRDDIASRGQNRFVTRTNQSTDNSSKGQNLGSSQGDNLKEFEIPEELSLTPGEEQFIVNLRANGFVDKLMTMTNKGMHLPISPPDQFKPNLTGQLSTGRGLESRQGGMNSTFFGKTTRDENNNEAGPLTQDTFFRPDGYLNPTANSHRMSIRMNSQHKSLNQKPRNSLTGRGNSNDSSLLNKSGKNPDLLNYAGRYESKQTPDKKAQMRKTLEKRLELLAKMHQQQAAGGNASIPEQLNPFSHIDELGEIDSEYLQDMYELLYPGEELHIDFTKPAPYFKIDKIGKQNRFLDPKSPFFNPRLEALRSEIKTFVETHTDCGPTCSHLLRFYQRKGFFKALAAYRQRGLMPISLPTLEVGQDRSTISELVRRHNHQEVKSFTLAYKQGPLTTAGISGAAGGTHGTH